MKKECSGRSTVMHAQRSQADEGGQGTAAVLTGFLLEVLEVGITLEYLLHVVTHDTDHLRRALDRRACEHMSRSFEKIAKEGNDEKRGCGSARGLV